MDSPLFGSSVDTLSTLVEEGARASKRATARFIEPAQGTLRRAESRRHHLVFGRRGSGKSSLLLKSAEALAEKGQPVAYVDLERFKGHHYPDVLISILLCAFAEFSSWLESYETPSKGRRLWYTGFIRRARTPQADAKGRVIDAFATNIADLERQLHASDAAQLVQTSQNSEHVITVARLKGNLSTSGPTAGVGLESELAEQAEATNTTEVSEAFARSKIDHLHRKILDYQKLFADLTELTGSDGFLFLDDLYHIRRSDQVLVLDYFHRLAKGHSVWLKVGTIKNRSTWYKHSPQPLGLKEGDDADDINLDLTLEKFSVSRSFLKQVLQSYIAEANAPAIEELLSEGALDRLVLSSGGVARDFLGILRRAIDEARERLSREPEHSRGPKISAEDVNVASGSYGDTKREEFQKDTLEDQERLDAAFQKLRRFCLDLTKANIFLVDQEMRNEDSDLLQELIDLRLIHHVRSRVTVSSRPGRVYRALLLDVSQYTGERMRRDIEMLEFWKDDREVLRKAALIYDPTITMPQLERAIADRRVSTRAAEEEHPTQATPRLDLDWRNPAPKPPGQGGT